MNFILKRISTLLLASFFFLFLVNHAFADGTFDVTSPSGTWAPPGIDAPFTVTTENYSPTLSDCFRADFVKAGGAQVVGGSAQLGFGYSNLTCDSSSLQFASLHIDMTDANNIDTNYYQFLVYNSDYSFQWLSNQKYAYRNGVFVPYNGIDQVTALAPAKVWVGLKNSDDVGVKFDLKAEAYVNGTLLSSGELNSVNAGSSGFNNAKLNTIIFNSFTPVDFPSGSSVAIKLYVRNACSGSGHNSGTARLWYNDSAANSQFGSTVGAVVNNSYYLIPSATLSTSVGSGPKQTIDVASGAKCSAFKLFGTWTGTP